MASNRRTVLVGLGLVIAAVAAYVLSKVLGTIAVAVAVSYMLLPVHKWLLRRHVPAYWSAIVTTVAGVAVSLVLLLPFGFVLYARREALVAGVNALDKTVSVTLGGEVVTLDLSPIREALLPSLSGLAISAAGRASVFSAKFVVYGFVVFALLYYHDRLKRLVFAPVPAGYHDVIEAVHRRIREVLFGHYVLVVVGGVVTYVTSLGVFLVLDYRFPLVLALVAAALWVLPFVSSAPLVVGLALFHLLAGEYVMVVAVAALGSIFLVAIPNLVVDAVRFRLGDPRRLSQTLYFLGFVGGGLTVGLVGIVVGPLVLTILVTLSALLAESGGGELLDDHVE